MKNMLTKLSLLANVGLVAAIVWMYVDHKAEKARTQEIIEQCASADELYIMLLSESLSALEPVESEVALKFKESIQPLVAVGLKNIELRNAFDFPR